jgi:metallo-beta-lactamase family protein
VVKAQVKEIKSMSAHGDRDDLLGFLSCQNPALVKKLFIVHGEYESQINFKATLEAE